MPRPCHKSFHGTNELWSWDPRGASPGLDGALGCEGRKRAWRRSGAAWEAGSKLPCRTKAPASASSSRCLCLRINSLQAVSLALPPGLEALVEEQSPGTAGMAGALPDGALQALARRASPRHGFLPNQHHPPWPTASPRVPRGRQGAGVGAARGAGHRHGGACTRFLYGQCMAVRLLVMHVSVWCICMCAHACASHREEGIVCSSACVCTYMCIPLFRGCVSWARVHVCAHTCTSRCAEGVCYAPVQRIWCAQVHVCAHMCIPLCRGGVLCVCICIYTHACIRLCRRCHALGCMCMHKCVHPAVERGCVVYLHVCAHICASRCAQGIVCSGACVCIQVCIPLCGVCRVLKCMCVRIPLCRGDMLCTDVCAHTHALCSENMCVVHPCV